MHSFLPVDSYLSYRDIPGVDTGIFIQWAKNFVAETVTLPSKFEYIVLLMDGYAAHVSYEALAILKKNNIVVVALPAHTTHRLQVLDMSVFSSFMNKVRELINDRSITNRGRNNDIYTLCEIITKAYEESLSSSIIRHGFAGCGLWVDQMQNYDATVIKKKDILNCVGYESREDAFKDYKDIMNFFKAARRELQSDALVLDKGVLNTKAGALLTDKEVMDALRIRAEEQKSKELEKEAKQKEKEIKAEEKRIIEAEKLAKRELERKRVEEYLSWSKMRPILYIGLKESRAYRRGRASYRFSGL